MQNVFTEFTVEQFVSMLRRDGYVCTDDIKRAVARGILNPSDENKTLPIGERTRLYLVTTSDGLGTAVVPANCIGMLGVPTRIPAHSFVEIVAFALGLQLSRTDTRAHGARNHRKRKIRKRHSERPPYRPGLPR